jgi:DNA polymerase
MTILWLDTETYSECDLKAHGTPRYAAHPSTEIMIAQWAIDDGEPRVWAAAHGPGLIFNDDVQELRRALDDPSVIVVAHNAFFDRTLIRHCWGIDVPIERWYCTMAQALAHGLPGGLGKAGEAMGLPQDQLKDKRGKDLVQLFCKPRPKNMKLRRATRETHPAEWAEFLEYSRQDVPAMRAVSKALPSWNFALPGAPGRLAGHRERKLWHLDQKINDRGFAVDTELAEAAIRATDIEKARLKAETVEATDGAVTNVSKRDQLLRYILEEHGVELPDMRADTLRRRIEDPELPEAVKLLLSIRLEATKSSTSKYAALLKAVSDDGRLRNTLQFAGAQRTARWAGRMFQPQNMTRPTLFQCVIDYGIEALKANTQADMVPIVLDSVMELAANAVRGCIVAAPGKKLTIADLANIEGRKLAFLAGEEWKLQAFRDFDTIIGKKDDGEPLRKGEDLYKLAYARSFNVDPSTATGKKRQIGKVMELGLGYEGGVAAFLTFAAVYNMDLDELTDAVHSTAPSNILAQAYAVLEWVKKKKRSTFGLTDQTYVACESLKIMWRNAHPATVQLWGDASNAVKRAIGKPGVPFAVGEHLVAQRDGAWLRVRLPSGRALCYLQPKVDDSGQITYMGVNQYTRQWGRTKTYGGKLIENATQAAARDVMAWNMPEIDDAGYEIVLTVHDELLTETPDEPGFSSDELAAMMSQVPPWAEGLPLAAAGFETYRYRKD